MFSLAHVTFANIDPVQEILLVAPLSAQGKNRSVGTVPAARRDIPHNTLALDSAASVSIIKNPNLLGFIKGITISCGGLWTDS